MATPYANHVPSAGARARPRQRTAATCCERPS